MEMCYEQESRIRMGCVGEVREGAPREERQEGLGETVTLS